MTVYVDDMFFPKQLQGRPAKWSHLMADTSDELRAFASRLGLQPHWIQHTGTYREHFDVTAQVRAKAIKFGAVEISYPRGTAELLARKRAPDTMGVDVRCVDPEA